MLSQLAQLARPSAGRSAVALRKAVLKSVILSKGDSYVDVLHFNAFLSEMSPVLFWKALKLPSTAKRRGTVEVLISKYNTAWCQTDSMIFFVHEHQSKSIKWRVQIDLSNLWSCELSLELPRLLSLNSCGSRKWHETARNLDSELAKVNFTVRSQPKSIEKSPPNITRRRRDSIRPRCWPTAAFLVLSQLGQQRSSSHRRVVQFWCVRKWGFIQKAVAFGLISFRIAHSWCTPFSNPLDYFIWLIHTSFLTRRSSPVSHRSVATDFFWAKISTIKHDVYIQLQRFPVDFSSTWNSTTVDHHVPGHCFLKRRPYSLRWGAFVPAPGELPNFKVSFGQNWTTSDGLQWYMKHHQNWAKSL